jgi:quinol monooxygenase YgiN
MDWSISQERSIAPCSRRNCPHDRQARFPCHHDRAAGQGRRTDRASAQRAVPAEPGLRRLPGRPLGQQPDIVYVTEGWTSQQAHSTFFATEQAQAFVAKLQPLLAGESQYTDGVPVGGKAAF